jgi:hypothetical protein
MNEQELLPMLVTAMEMTARNAEICQTALKALDKCMKNGEILSAELLAVRAERDALKKGIQRREGPIWPPYPPIGR